MIGLVLTLLSLIKALFALGLIIGVICLIISFIIEHKWKAPVEFLKKLAKLAIPALAIIVVFAACHYLFILYIRILNIRYSGSFGIESVILGILSCVLAFSYVNKFLKHYSASTKYNTKYIVVLGSLTLAALVSGLSLISIIGLFLFKGPSVLSENKFYWIFISSLMLFVISTWNLKKTE